MLKSCHISMPVGILLVLLALQGAMGMRDAASAAASSTSPSTAQEPGMSNATTSHSDDQADAYQAALGAYEAGATLAALGQHDAALDKFQQAAGLFKQVTEASPTHFKAIVNWGAALARMGKPAEAVLKYQQALALVPDHVNRAETLHNWGTALERLGRHQEAIEKFDQAIALKADLLSPALQDYLQRHRLRQQDSEIHAPEADSPTRQ